MKNLENSKPKRPVRAKVVNLLKSKRCETCYDNLTHITRPRKRIYDVKYFCRCEKPD